jgi:hypothetical protein
MAELFSLPALMAIIENAIKRRAEIKTAPISQLPLELLVIESTLNKEQSPELSTTFEQQIKQPNTNEKTNDNIKKTETNIQNQTNIEPPKSTMSKIKEKVSAFTHRKPLKTTYAEIKERWTEIIEKITIENHSLGFILKMSSAHKIEDNTLLIAVPYSFHKDKLEEIKNKKIIECQLENFFAEKIDFYCQVISSSQSYNNPVSLDQELNKLAADFGGEVVS